MSVRLSVRLRMMNVAADVSFGVCMSVRPSVCLSVGLTVLNVVVESSASVLVLSAAAILEVCADADLSPAVGRVPATVPLSVAGRVSAAVRVSVVVHVQVDPPDFDLFVFVVVKLAPEMARVVPAAEFAFADRLFSVE